MNEINDNKLKFYEKSHKYKVKGKELTSVTTFISKFFKKFDAKAIARRLAMFNRMKGVKGRGVRYYLKLWKDQTNDGSIIHKEIEDAINMPKYETHSYTKKKTLNGIKFVEEVIANDNILPEVMIYSEELGLAGTIDLVRFLGDNVIRIYDWKTNKEIKKVGYKGEKAPHKLTCDLDDCNFNKYSLQLNLYAYILEKEYGYKVDKMQIVHLTEEEAIPMTIKFDYTRVERLLKDED